MKTVRQHLNDLKEPERTSALKAMEGSAWGHEYQQHPKLADALYVAFDWASSFHGNAYWGGIWAKLDADTYFDGTPQKITSEVKEFTAPELTERMATDEDHEELDKLIDGVLSNAAPPTEPNFGTKLPDSGDRSEFDTGAVRDASQGKGVPSHLPTRALMRVSQRFEDGAAKYNAHNWRKGIPLSRYVDSLNRHLWAFMQGDTTEDHLGAITWNAMCLSETYDLISEGKLPEPLNDLPEHV